MLVLGRKRGESLVIGAAGVTLIGPIVVSIERIERGAVRIGIQAQDDVPIHRKEMYEAMQREHMKGARHESK